MNHNELIRENNVNLQH